MIHHVFLYREVNMNHCLTWNDMTELFGTIVVIFFLGCIVGGAVVAHFKNKSN